KPAVERGVTQRRGLSMKTFSKGTTLAGVVVGTILLGGGGPLASRPTAAGQTSPRTPADKSIDPATVTAYQKLAGAFFCGSQYRTFLGWDLYDRGEPGVPGFSFRKLPGSKLPALAAPFGLDLLQSDVTDANLKGLAGLENLTSLSLFGT